ncbi:MAG: hypothetical protein U0559_09330 [Anaerolineae bacterium]
MLRRKTKRAEGYGIIRVGFNLAVTIGLAIMLPGDAVVSCSLFIADAVISTITAAIVFFFIRD